MTISYDVCDDPKSGLATLPPVEAAVRSAYWVLEAIRWFQDLTHPMSSEFLTPPVHRDRLRSSIERLYRDTERLNHFLNNTTASVELRTLHPESVSFQDTLRGSHVAIVFFLSMKLLSHLAFSGRAEELGNWLRPDPRTAGLPPLDVGQIMHNWDDVLERLQDYRESIDTDAFHQRIQTELCHWRNSLKVNAEESEETTKAKRSGRNPLSDDNLFEFLKRFENGLIEGDWTNQEGFAPKSGKTAGTVSRTLDKARRKFAERYRKGLAEGKWKSPEECAQATGMYPSSISNILVRVENCPPRCKNVSKNKAQ